MIVDRTPVRWREVAVIAAVAFWAWGVGYWMSSKFTDFDSRIKATEDRIKTCQW